MILYYIISYYIAFDRNCLHNEINTPIVNLLFPYSRVSRALFVTGSMHGVGMRASQLLPPALTISYTVSRPPPSLSQGGNYQRAIIHPLAKHTIPQNAT